MDLALRLIALGAVVSLSACWLQARLSGFGCGLQIAVIGLIVIGGQLIVEPFNAVVVGVYALATVFLVRVTTSYVRAMKRIAGPELVSTDGMGSSDDVH